MLFITLIKKYLDVEILVNDVVYAVNFIKETLVRGSMMMSYCKGIRPTCFPNPDFFFRASKSENHI